MITSQDEGAVERRNRGRTKKRKEFVSIDLLTKLVQLDFSFNTCFARNVITNIITPFKYSNSLELIFVRIAVFKIGGTKI